MGRFLVRSPFLPSVAVAGGAILATGDQVAAQAYLPGIASGKTTAALAVAESGGLWSFGQLSASARPVKGDSEGGMGGWAGGGGWLGTGSMQFVLDGAAADLLVGPAHTDSGPSFFAVQADACGQTPPDIRALGR